MWEVYEKAQEKPLGTGMTGAVYLVRHRTTGDMYALKSIDKSKMNEDLLDDLRNEIELLGVVRCLCKMDALSSLMLCVFMCMTVLSRVLCFLPTYSCHNC